MNTMSLFTELLATASATPMLAAATAAAAAVPEKTAPSGLQLVYEFLATGGFVMALLVLCSMSANGASILAWLQLRAQVIMPSAVVSQLRSIPSYALKGDIRPLQEFLSHDGSMLSRLGSMAISGAFTSKQTEWWVGWGGARRVHSRLLITALSAICLTCWPAN